MESKLWSRTKIWNPFQTSACWYLGNFYQTQLSYTFFHFKAWMTSYTQINVWDATLIHFLTSTLVYVTLLWRRNGHGSVSNHQPHHCLLNRLFECRSKKTSKLRVTGLCAGNSPGTGEFPAQMASDAENVSIWWRHHETTVIVRTWMSDYIQQNNWVELFLIHALISNKKTRVIETPRI